ncbi:hypothetical protein C8J56DRAFT_788004, partial [Mycena floridula]
EYFGLKGVLAQPSVSSSRIPALVFCIYQLMFASIMHVFSLSHISISSQDVSVALVPRNSFFNGRTSVPDSSMFALETTAA